MEIKINAGVRFSEKCIPNEMNVFPTTLNEVLDIFISYHEEVDLEKMSYYNEASDEFFYRKDGFTMMEGSNLGAIAAISDKYIPYIITYAYLKKHESWRKLPIVVIPRKIREIQTKDNMYRALIDMNDKEERTAFSMVFKPKWTEDIYKKWRTLLFKHELSISEINYIYELIDERNKI